MQLQYGPFSRTIDGTPPRKQLNNESAATVHIPEYYADVPMAWFRSINATFPAGRITKPITKFHGVLPNLPATLIDTIGPL